MYETMDACNIKPIMPVDSTQRSNVPIYGNNFIETSICFEFSDKKGLSAVRSEKEPQSITSGQHFDDSSFTGQAFDESSQNSYSSNSFNSASIQYQPELPYYPIDSSTSNFSNSNYNFGNVASNSNDQFICNKSNYYFNGVLNYEHNGLTNCINSIGFYNDNKPTSDDRQEDEFESVINPRTKSEPPTERMTNPPSTSCPLYIEPFSSYFQSNVNTNSQLQANPEMTTMMIPTFSLDFINPYNYLSQDTEDAFASVIYSTPPQIKPVLCSTTQTQSTLSQFYSDNNKDYNSNFNYNFSSCYTTDAAKQNNIYAPISSFPSVLSSENDDLAQSENIRSDQTQQQNKNSCLNSSPTKHRQRISSNEYKKYRSPATLIIQFPTLATINGSDSQKIPSKNSSGASISVSSERRGRTRKASSSPLLGKPPRNNFTDIDVDDKKPVINFQKPTISSSSNSEKNNSQSENRKHESFVKSKIRGRR